MEKKKKKIEHSSSFFSDTLESQRESTSHKKGEEGKSCGPTQAPATSLAPFCTPLYRNHLRTLTSTCNFIYITYPSRTLYSDLETVYHCHHLLSCRLKPSPSATLSLLNDWKIPLLLLKYWNKIDREKYLIFLLCGPRKGERPKERTTHRLCMPLLCGWSSFSHVLFSSFHSYLSLACRNAASRSLTASRARWMNQLFVPPVINLINSNTHRFSLHLCTLYFSQFVPNNVPLLLH